MVLLFVSSVIGIIIGLLIDLKLSIALYFLSMALCFVFKMDIKKIILFYLCVLLFFFYTKIEINHYDTKYVDGSMEDDITILSYASEKQKWNRFLCYNKKKDHFFIYFPKEDSFEKGDEVHIVGNLVLPDTARNQGGFNARRYCNSQKIYGYIYVQKYEKVKINQFHFIYFLQNKIHQSFEIIFPKDEMGLVLGMMIGETNDISESTLEDFQETGITHLIAVSGSNVMYVLFCVQFVFNKICGKRKTCWIAILVLIIFMLVSGATSSVMRATIMAILTLLSEVFYQKPDPIYHLSFSGFLLICLNPLIVYDVGFILSFGGTIGIIFLSPKLEVLFQKWGKFSNILATTCSAQLVLAPVMAFYFNTFSIVSILVNIIVVPISGLITIFGFMVFFISLICFPLANMISKCLFVFTHFTIAVANFFSQIPFSTIKVVTPNLLEIIFFYILLFYATGKFSFYPFKEKRNLHHKIKTIKIAILIFVLLEMIYYYFPRNYISIHCIDVGQGDAIYIHSSHHKNILVDGGGSETYDVGEKVVVPYLLDQRVLCIDAIFSSHSDADHLNGILTVIQNIRVKTIYIARGAKGYETLYEIANEKNIPIVELKLDDTVIIDDIRYTVVGPAPSINCQDVNAYSLVLKMEYQNKSMLLTGDMNQEAESKMKNVTANILKVAHHGSNTSSSQKFVAIVHPQISIISVKKNNAYGHPDKEVVKRLEKYSIVYTTAEYGEITIKMGKDWIKVE